MNTLRYKPEYYDGTVALLKNTQNMVDLPSDIFFDIARLFENGESDKAKFEKLIKKTYTVLAIEDEEVIGLAGMDGEGNVGLFAVRGGESFLKTCKLLSKALERRAAKRELPYLFVLQTQESEDTFIGLGYELFDNGSGAVNEAILSKAIEFKDKIDIKPEQVKEIKLDPRRKITVEGKTSVFPAFFMGLACFFAFLLITITVSEIYAGTFSEVPKSSYTPIAAFVGVFFTAALALFIAYLIRGRRLRKEVLSMRVTNGVIISLAADRVWDSSDGFPKSSRYDIPEYSYVSLTYVYYDENMQKREAHFRHKYRFDGPYFFEGQELVIAHSGEKSYILHSYSLIQSQTVQPSEAEIPVPPKPLSECDLSGCVPLKAVKRYYFGALGYLAMTVIVLVFLLILNVFIASQTNKPYGSVLLNSLAFASPVIAIPAVICAIALIVPTVAKKNYKKLLQQKGAFVAEGKLTFSSDTFKSDNKFRFYCEYFDGAKQKKIAVPRLYTKKMVREGNFKVKVLFDNDTAIVLVKKHVFPDRL